MHWSETEPSLGGAVPLALTEHFGAHQRVMRGTWEQRPRCVALQGEVGQAAHCGIYEQRPTPCRELKMSWQDGAPSPQCDKARSLHGLAPLTREEVAALGLIEG
jgi:Fe-S-cluster containining protein